MKTIRIKDVNGKSLVIEFESTGTVAVDYQAVTKDHTTTGMIGDDIYKEYWDHGGASWSYRTTVDMFIDNEQTRIIILGKCEAYFA